MKRLEPEIIDYYNTEVLKMIWMRSGHLYVLKHIECWKMQSLE